MLPAAFAIGAYVLLSGQPENHCFDPRDIKRVAGRAPLKEQTLSGDSSGMDVSIAEDEGRPRAVQVVNELGRVGVGSVQIGDEVRQCVVCNGHSGRGAGIR